MLLFVSINIYFMLMPLSPVLHIFRWNIAFNDVAKINKKNEYKKTTIFF